MTEPLADVEVVRDGERWTLVFVRDLRHAPEDVWDALTQPERLAAWAPYTADRALGTRGAATLVTTDRDDAEELPADVRVAERPRVLEHTWGDDLLRWELAPTSDGTRLTLRHTVEEREGTPMYSAGWHLCLGVLDRVLAGERVEPIVGERAMDFGWADLRDRYAATLGVEATAP